MDTWYVILFMMIVSFLLMTMIISFIQKEWNNSRYEYIDSKTEKIEIEKIREVLDEESSRDNISDTSREIEIL